MTEQWPVAYVGGGEYPVYLMWHKACGAYVADQALHAKTCTAPPWDPTARPSNIGETHDWYIGGNRA